MDTVKDTTQKREGEELKVERYIFHKGEVTKIGEVPFPESFLARDPDLQLKAKAHTRSPRPITMEDLERLGDPLPEGIVFRRLDL